MCYEFFLALFLSVMCILEALKVGGVCLQRQVEVFRYGQVRVEVLSCRNVISAGLSFNHSLQKDQSCCCKQAAVGLGTTAPIIPCAAGLFWSSWIIFYFCRISGLMFGCLRSAEAGGVK